MTSEAWADSTLLGAVAGEGLCWMPAGAWCPLGNALLLEVHMTSCHCLSIVWCIRRAQKRLALLFPLKISFILKRHVSDVFSCAFDHQILILIFMEGRHVCFSMALPLAQSR